MEFSINRYHGRNNQYGFDEYGSSAWMTQKDWQTVFGDDSPPLVVKMECKCPSPFVFMCKVNSLNPKSDLSSKNGYIHLPYEIIAPSYLIGKDSKVDISVVNVDALPLAQTVTIELPADNNTYWSESEKKDAVDYFVKNESFSFVDKMSFLFPSGKKPVSGRITHIIPQKSQDFHAYRIDDSTRIVFENLRTDEEKILDLQDIGGLDETIKKLRKIIQLPMNHPEYYSRFGIDRPKGLLLYGPPGNGKTTIAKAIAKSLGGAAFISVNLTEVWASRVGDGERILESKFKEAEKIGNCIIFIDEIDSIAMIRKQGSAGYEVTLVGTLLSLMDGLNSNSKVFVIGATNRRDAIDPALRRPGRFDIEEEIPIPQRNARKDILKKYVNLSNRHLYEDSVDDVYLDKVSEITNGFSGADLKCLYREAALSAISRSVDFDENGKEIIVEDVGNCRIGIADFEKAKELTTPSALRGLEDSSTLSNWGSLLAVDQYKSKMESFHDKMLYLTKQERLMKRPSFATILISGEKGTGKETFVKAFAKHFNYEFLLIDVAELEAYSSLSLAYQEINNIFVKLRQVGKVTLLIKNLDSRNDYIEKYLLYISNQIEKLSSRLPSFIIFTCTDGKWSHKLNEIQKCGEHWNFDVAESELKKIFKNKGVSIPSTAPTQIGSLLSFFEEQELLNKYNAKV